MPLFLKRDVKIGQTIEAQKIFFLMNAINSQTLNQFSIDLEPQFSDFLVIEEAQSLI